MKNKLKKFTPVFMINVICIGVVLMSACNDTGSSPVSISKESSAVPVDTAQFTALVRNMYQWYETKSTKGDFMPADIAAGESAYREIDWKAHEKKVNEINKSGLFAVEFIENYNKIAHHIDSEIKAGKVTWLEGDMSPFSRGADAWCNCQDSPAHYYENMKVSVLEAGNSRAVLQWMFDDTEDYTVKAVREKGSWKILWLQGFDIKDYSGQ